MSVSSAVTHLVYIPGLGDGYDSFRRRALARWKHPGLEVSFVPMRWRDPTETYEQKLARINEVIDQKPGCRTVLVGESAGGAMAVSVSSVRPDITKVITICGKNVRSDNVSASVYVRNPAFRQAMRLADAYARQLRTARSDTSYVAFYSPFDRLVRLADTELPGAEMRRLPTVGHLLSIFAVLVFLHGKIMKESLR